jgi:hypothetical protein
VVLCNKAPFFVTIPSVLLGSYENFGELNFLSVRREICREGVGSVFQQKFETITQTARFLNPEFLPVLIGLG